MYIQCACMYNEKFSSKNWLFSITNVHCIFMFNNGDGQLAYK